MVSSINGVGKTGYPHAQEKLNPYLIPLTKINSKRIKLKNLPANAGDTGLSPGPGRSHMPQSN